MLDIFSKIFDSLFPPHESIRQLKAENAANFTRHFSPHRFANCIALSDYSNPSIKAAVTANKFHDHEEAATLLSTLVEHWLNTLPVKPTIFIPIPLSPVRQKSRGYNQVVRVLEKTQTKNVRIENLLSRTKETRPQTSLNRTDRFKNVEGAFVYQNIQLNLAGTRVVIIDDVVTTGATMFAAEKSLSEHLPIDCEVICIALAH
jgi:ComF family protein